MNDLQKGILTLVRSAIIGEKLPLPAGFRLEEADRLIRDHSLLPLAYQGAYNCGISPKEPLMQEYQKLYFAILMRHERQRRAIEQVFRAFEERGIDYLPLKGCVMKPLYPNPELRIMADADILIRLEQRQDFEEVMNTLGYQKRSDGTSEESWTGNDLHLDVHRALLPPEERDLQKYFGAGWDLAVKEAGCRYGFSPEDTYAFLFVHMAKHFRRYGIGPRQLVDLYVYRRAHPELDMKRVERIMETIRLRKFHTNILHLLDRWFGEAQWDGLTWTITEYVFSGGNWGLVENAMRYDAVLESSRSGDRGSRSKALWRQVFPPLEVLQCRYPVLLKHPERYRVYYAVRWKDILLHNRQNVGKKLSIVRDLDDETVRNHREFLLSMGLDVTTEE